MVEEKINIIFYSILLFSVILCSIVIVQKSRVYPFLFCSNNFHKEKNPPFFMNTALYPRKESTLWVNSLKGQLDRYYRDFSPNYFEYRLCSLHRHYCQLLSLFCLFYNLSLVLQPLLLNAQHLYVRAHCIASYSAHCPASPVCCTAYPVYCPVSPGHWHPLLARLS